MYVCVQLYVENDIGCELKELTDKTLLAQWYGRSIDHADAQGYVTSLSPLMRLTTSTYEFSAYLSPNSEREAHLQWLQRDMTICDSKRDQRRWGSSREKHNWIVRRAKTMSDLAALEALAARLLRFRLGKKRCVRTNVLLKQKMPPHVSFVPR